MCRSPPVNALTPVAPHRSSLHTGVDLQLVLLAQENNARLQSTIQLCRRDHSMARGCPQMLAVLVLMMCHSGPALAIKCYVPTPTDRSRVIAAVYEEPGTSCVRYQFVCTKGDQSCSSQDMGRLKWAYTFVASSSCAEMKKAPTVYKNFYCCNSDLCNAPDAKLDPATKVIPGVLKLGPTPADAKKKP